jgi:hypothetical protein
MIGWFGLICYCPDCRRRFFEETGREIPTVVDWYNPEWVEFQRKREEWYVDFTKIIDNTVRSLKQDVSITYQCAGWLGGWSGAVTQEFMSMSDYLRATFMEIR